MLVSARHLRFHSLLKSHSSHPRSGAARDGDGGDARDDGEVHAAGASRRSCPSLGRRRGVHFRIRHLLSLTLCSWLERSCQQCLIARPPVDCHLIVPAARPLGLHGPFVEQLGKF